MTLIALLHRSTLPALLAGLSLAPVTACMAAAPDAPPARQDGLWEVRLQTWRNQSPVGGTQVLLQCTTRDTERIMLMAVVPGQEQCSRYRTRKLPTSKGGGVEVQTTCSVHGQPVVSRLRLKGDLQRTYTGDFRSTLGQGRASQVTEGRFEGRWLGPCRAGQQPGDMVLPNGITVKVVQDHANHTSHHHTGHAPGADHHHPH